MKSYIKQEVDGQTWRQVRRWLLAILGPLAVLLAVLVVQCVLLQRTLRRIEARGGSVGAADAPRWLAHLIGADARPNAAWVSDPPSWPLFLLHDHYALRHDCAITFWRDPGAEGLADVEGLRCVVVLQVPSTSVSDAEIHFFRGLARLRFLNLHGTRVTGPGLEHLRGLRMLRSLELGGTALDDAGLARLDELPALERLGLGHTRVTGIGLRHLARFRSLRSLYLEGTRIDDQALGFLAGLPLTDLDLHCTGVTDAGLGHLERLPTLSRINLGDTAVSDEGLETLKRLPNLSEIDLSGTRVTDGAARRLLGKVARP